MLGNKSKQTLCAVPKWWKHIHCYWLLTAMPYLIIKKTAICFMCKKISNTFSQLQLEIESDTN